MSTAPLPQDLGISYSFCLGQPSLSCSETDRAALENKLEHREAWGWLRASRDLGMCRCHGKGTGGLRQLSLHTGLKAQTHSSQQLGHTKPWETDLPLSAPRREHVPVAPINQCFTCLVPVNAHDTTGAHCLAPSLLFTSSHTCGFTPHGQGTKDQPRSSHKDLALCHTGP